ncbi:MAG: carbamoyltransferase HypF [Euryarchaeota archaeon]|nr:carbamoyltransferase HypF [Euryarchaeota archaeon]
MRAEITIKGIVQGVGFRPFIYRIAVKNKLVGFVRNRGDAGVEIVVEGNDNNIKQFLTDLEEKKPPLAQIYDLITNYSEEKKEFEKFTILKSSEGGELSGSVIPPDVSICNECLAELRDSNNRRYDYFFITCTDCGPRYSIIEELPYDRPNTTMQEFLMCNECKIEYTDPSNRRFHAQTVACSKCGPKIFLTNNGGELIKRGDPIREAGRLLEEGYIVAIKGNGGFHIAAATTRSDPVKRLRKTKHRSQKPFAIMARDLETIKTFAEVSEEEAKLLTSYIKPIVLLRKSDDYYLSDLISPGLHNIGVMLPYTGLHSMLFDQVQEPAFIMTSANPPNEPIIKENDRAIKELGSVVDFFLFHDRKIAQRCDDSVVRINNKIPSIIRRSRGYAPAPIHLKYSINHCTLGISAELNATTCVLLGNKAFISQHIGDIEKFETFEFLKSATNHLIKLTNSKVEVVACDLHPRFHTTKLAHELGNKLGCNVIPVQHHHAHIASLMGEHNISEIIGIACDGIGYGSDGNVWGGEVLFCNSNGFQRVGHLQEQPMIGGDLATKYPARMVVGILHSATDIEKWLLSNVKHFPHGEKEVEIVLKQLKQGNFIKTTSCGRVLDAVSALLGICYERTYEGEPAMKLESVAIKGKDALQLSPETNGNTLNTTYLLSQIYDNMSKYPVADLACSAQSYIAIGLAQLAIEEAKKLGIDTIGFSGGVAYNEFITLAIKKEVEMAGLKFVTNVQVPPGDGGISFGQAIATSYEK